VRDRNRRMVSLKTMTSRFTKRHDEPAYRVGLLEGLPGEVFGPAAAAHVEKVALIDGWLVVVIPEEAWRKELERHRGRLSHRARQIYPKLKGASFVAGIRDDDRLDSRR